MIQTDARKIKIILPLLIMLTASACDLKVPIKEMVQAKKSIDEAYKYRADRYSSEELKNAELKLLESNEFLKNKKDDEAKKTALASYTLSQQALKNALPLYSADTIELAEKSYSNAERAYAERFSPDKFAAAGRSLEEARIAAETGNFRKSIDEAYLAHSMAEQALAESLRNSALLENDLRSLKTRMSALKQNRFAGDAAEDIKQGEENLNMAESSLKEQDFKTAATAIDTARDYIEIAENTVTGKALYARILELRQEINKALAADDTGIVRNDLDRASLALNRAETLIENKDFNSAERDIKEAENLISMSQKKKREALLLARLRMAQAELAAARDMDQVMAHRENLDRAAALLDQGDRYLKEGKYKESEDRIDEAETIIAAIKHTLETAAIAAQLESAPAEEEKAEETAVTEEEMRIYVVQWRAKNTDCLWRISLALYNDASLWPAIYIANKDQIKDPDLIFPGQKLRIPPKPDRRPEFRRN